MADVELKNQEFASCHLALRHLVGDSWWLALTAVPGGSNQGVNSLETAAFPILNDASSDFTSLCASRDKHRDDWGTKPETEVVAVDDQGLAAISLISVASALPSSYQWVNFLRIGPTDDWVGAVKSNKLQMYWVRLVCACESVMVSHGHYLLILHVNIGWLAPMAVLFVNAIAFCGPNHDGRTVWRSLHLTSICNETGSSWSRVVERFIWYIYRCGDPTNRIAESNIILTGSGRCRSDKLGWR